MTNIVSVDIGGTHARFALAEVRDGRVVSLGEATTLKTSEHASFQTAWEDYGRIVGKALPRAVTIAIAGPVQGEIIRFTNNPWIIRPALICEKLGVDAFTLVNDFGAIGHAVAQAGDDNFQHMCGPDVPLPETGTISIIGPGTGLGVAHVFRDGAQYRVQATEGGHIDFEVFGAEGIGREVDGEAVSVIEFEGNIAGQFLSFGQRRCFVFEHFQAAVEHLFKTRFFVFQRFDDQPFRAFQFRIGIAHHRLQRREKFVHQRFCRAQQMCVAHTAAHDAAENVTTSFIRWHNTIGKKEGRTTQMVCDYAVAWRLIAVGGHAREV